jgi:signal transduction histidine kinase
MSLTVHELRTPVTVVSGYLRMLLKEQGGPLTERQRKMLEEADRSCGRIGALVSEMSELGKLDAGEITLAHQKIDIAALLRDVASDMHEGDSRGVRIELRGVDHPLVVSGDGARLARALGSLIHSALRERGEPGVVIIDCAKTAASLVIRIGDEDALASPATRTSDTSFDEWRGGLGLALPIARRTVTAHGGKIWSASGDRPRAGAVVELPLNGAP